MAQAEENGVFRSQDGGQTWTRTSWSQPGSSLVGLAVAPGDAAVWVLALQDGVNTLWRSADSGVSWDALDTDEPPSDGEEPDYGCAVLAQPSDAGGSSVWWAAMLLRFGLRARSTRHRPSRR